MRMAHGTYHGPIQELRGKTALVMESEAQFVKAQFDDKSIIYKGEALAFGWHTFQRADFSVPDWASPVDQGEPQFSICRQTTEES